MVNNKPLDAWNAESTNDFNISKHENEHFSTAIDISVVISFGKGSKRPLEARFVKCFIFSSILPGYCFGLRSSLQGDVIYVEQLQFVSLWYLILLCDQFDSFHAMDL